MKTEAVNECVNVNTTDESILRPQVTMSDLTATALSTDIAAYCGISHAELAGQIEWCLTHESEWEENLQEERLNRSTHLFTRYRMTTIGVDEVVKYFPGDDVDKRRQEYVAAMDAAEDALAHLWEPLRR